jgi:hypothetical protein
LRVQAPLFASGLERKARSFAMLSVVVQLSLLPPDSRDVALRLTGEAVLPDAVPRARRRALSASCVTERAFVRAPGRPSPGDGTARGSEKALAAPARSHVTRQLASAPPEFTRRIRTFDAGMNRLVLAQTELWLQRIRLQRRGVKAPAAGCRRRGVKAPVRRVVFSCHGEPWNRRPLRSNRRGRRGRAGVIHRMTRCHGLARRKTDSRRRRRARPVFPDAYPFTLTISAAYSSLGTTKVRRPVD